MEPLSIGTSPRRSKKYPKAAWGALFAVAALVVVLFFFLALVGIPATGSAESVTFLVLGDWGREGTRNQTNVAVLMSKVALGLDRKPDAVISCGDNMYGELFPMVSWSVLPCARLAC